MAIRYIYLENNTIPREITMGTLRWMGVPEGEVMLVEGTYEDTKSRVLCGPGVSGEPKVNVGLTQGSALSPLLHVYLCGETDKQQDLYKSHTPETIVRRWPGSGRGWGSKSPRTVDRVERYYQQTWSEGRLGEDGGNVSGT